MAQWFTVTCTHCPAFRDDVPDREWADDVAELHRYRHHTPAATSVVHTGKSKPRPPEVVGQQLASTVTDLRLAVELARSALRLGRHRDAQAHLDAVAADPGRRR